MTTGQQKIFRIQHNGRNFPVGKDGTLQYLDTQAFEATIKDGLEMENYLSRLTAYILRGDDVCIKFFGPEFLGFCTPVEGEQNVNGLKIPAALAK